MGFVLLFYLHLLFVRRATDGSLSAEGDCAVPRRWRSGVLSGIYNPRFSGRNHNPPIQTGTNSSDRAGCGTRNSWHGDLPAANTAQYTRGNKRGFHSCRNRWCINWDRRLALVIPQDRPANLISQCNPGIAALVVLSYDDRFCGRIFTQIDIEFKLLVIFIGIYPQILHH